MKRVANIFMIVLMLFGAVGVYTIKNRSESVGNRITELRAGIKQEEQLIGELSAEWAVLRQPPFLQAQVKQHHEQLNLQQLEPVQFGSVAELPERPLTIELLIDKSLGDLFAQSEGAVR